jgi:hypothetical protein
LRVLSTTKPAISPCSMSGLLSPWCRCWNRNTTRRFPATDSAGKCLVL